MIFFPTIYEDELLYSVISRYHVKSGNTSCRQTLEDVFNEKNIVLGIYLPSNINIMGYTKIPTENNMCITVSGRGTIGYSCIRKKPFVLL